MDDLINRQDAIDTLSVSREMLSRVLDEGYVVGTEREKFSFGLGLIESSIKDIEELPPAQPRERLAAKIEVSEEQIRDALEKMRNEPLQIMPSAKSEISYTKADYIMALHKEYGVSLEMAAKAHDKAIEYLRSKAKLKG